jgi:two-component system cell cycle sensor histidine kinase/response regulator CckA
MTGMAQDTNPPATVLPIAGEAGRVDAAGCTASAAMVRDVTEPHRAEAAQARDMLAALGRTAGGIGHELNNLLQPIIGLTQLELDQLPDEGTPEQIETRDSLAVILESARQARDVVRKLLMFAGKAKPELAPVDFPAALGRVIASLRKQLPPQIHLDYAVHAGAAGLANINEAELAEVMAHLARNAADAMGGCGTVVIRADRLAVADRASLGIAAGPTFRVSVTDTGHGIDEKTRTQIFEPFFTTRPAEQGTGLGLSIVHGVLRDWKGAIAVESAVGRGSTFTFYVPVLAIP